MPTSASPGMGLRVIDADGKFVGIVSRTSGDKIAASGKAKLEGTGRKLVLRLASRIDLDKSQPAKSTSYTYPERYAGHVVVVLKRLHPDGTFHTWDNDLSFEELRRGKTRTKHHAISSDC